MIRPRFSLRAIVVAVTVLTVFGGGIVERRHRHQSATKRIVRAGGSFEGFVSEPIGPNSLWMWNSGIDWPAPSVGVYFSSKFERWVCVTAGRELCFRDQHDSAILNETDNLFLLRSLTLVRSSVPRFPRSLETIILIDVEWDENACESLCRVKKLEYLRIVNCSVPDRDLLQMAKTLESLEHVELSGMTVSGKTLTEMSEALPACEICYSRTHENSVEEFYIHLFPSMERTQP